MSDTTSEAEGLRQMVLRPWCTICNGAACQRHHTVAEMDEYLDNEWEREPLWIRWPTSRPDNLMWITPATVIEAGNLSHLDQGRGWYTKIPEGRVPASTARLLIIGGIREAARAEGRCVHFYGKMVVIHRGGIITAIGHGPDDLHRLVAAAHQYRDSVEKE